MSDDYDDYDDDHDYSDEDIENLVLIALQELLNIAGSVAELQTTDEAAEEIYAVCDLVAEYYGIGRAKAIIEEHEDGSYTTRFEPLEEPEVDHKTVSIPGSIRTKGRPKFRVIDNSRPSNKNK